MKRVAIVQSAYIPWKGYFDLINLADEVILLDNVQFTRRDWRNRNKIKTANGTLWLTIPVETKGRYRSLINEMEVADADWAAQHWKSIAHWYRRSPGFQTYGSLFEELFLGCEESNLSRINRRFLTAISQLLGSRTRITTATDYDIVSGRSERLWHLCEQVGATHYLSGPAATGYLDQSAFAARGIEIEWMDYTGYAEYRQAFPPFEHRVSIVDLLLNEGTRAVDFLKSF